MTEPSEHCSDPGPRQERFDRVLGETEFRVSCGEHDCFLVDEDYSPLMKLRFDFMEDLDRMPDVAALAVLRQVHDTYVHAMSVGLRRGESHGREAVIGSLHELLGVTRIVEALEALERRAL